LEKDFLILYKESKKINMYLVGNTDDSSILLKRVHLASISEK